MTHQTLRACDLHDDESITLQQACQAFFRGTIKVATLMAEHERGNLKLEKIGRRYFTTPRYIREMKEKCRVQEKHRASLGETAVAPNPDNGSSVTAQVTSAQAALDKTLRQLKQGSPTTSPTSTVRQTARIHQLSRPQTP